MSTSSKGAELERRAIAVLSAEQYLVHRTIRTPILKWAGGRPIIVGSHSNDVFNVFDVVGAHPKKGFLWVQVTDSAHLSARMKKVQEVLDNFPDDANVEVWGWVGGGKRLDKRHKEKPVFLRRQYFRKSRWSFHDDEWYDVTPASDGWIDGPPPAPSA